jgi:hypothetical protein
MCNHLLTGCLTMTTSPLIDEIRTASRLMVRELGFMSATLAATDYSPSAVHTLLEISLRGAMTAAQLVQILGSKNRASAECFPVCWPPASSRKNPPPATGASSSLR